MGDNYKTNKTRLTSVEIRWIKQAYKQGVLGSGYRAIAKRINEGRAKAGINLISVDVVLYAIHRMDDGAVLIPSDTAGKQKIKCPECGHEWYK